MLNKNKIKLISFLIFKIDNDVFASESKKVKCILDLDELTNTKILDNYTYVKLGERNVLLMDACEKLFQISTDELEKKSLLVMELNDNSTWVGIAVNRIFSETVIDIEQYTDMTFIGNKYLLNAVQGVFNMHSSLVKVLNIDKLADEYCSRYKGWFDEKVMVCN